MPITIQRINNVVHVKSGRFLIGSFSKVDGINGKDGGFLIRKTGLCAIMKVVLVPFRTEDECIAHICDKARILCARLTEDLDPTIPVEEEK